MRQVLRTLLLLTVGISATAQVSSPPDLKWHKDLTEKVTEASRLASNDPVSSWLLFQEILSGGRKPNKEQKAWLQEQLTALQPRALEVLQRDYDAAAKMDEPRGMLIAAHAAEKISPGALRKQPSLEEIQKRVLAGGVSAPIWRISEESASVAKGYSEFDFAVIVPKGSQVLRVKARVENISAETDPSYLLPSLGFIKRVLARSKAGSDKQRWLDQDFLFVATHTGEVLPCKVIVSGLDTSPIKLFSPGGGVGVIWPPAGLKQGESTRIDAVFVVPMDSKDFRLVILGSAPVPLVPGP